MSHEGFDTRKKLIIAAGKLFAEKGYEGVSTRMIAEEAQVNLGGIHYHFGSKEKLYVELFRFALKMGDDDLRSAQDLKTKHPEWNESPESQAEIILELIKKMYQKVAYSEYSWKLPLFVRESFQPSPANATLVEEVFRPMVSEILEFSRELAFGLPEEEMAFFAFFPASQTMFYLMRMKSIREVSLKDFDEAEFYKHLTRFTAKAMILYLGLPLPDELRQRAHAAAESKKSEPET